MLPSYTVCSKLTKLSNLDDFDMDENLIHAVDSRYVQIPELNELRPTKQSFSLFHMNVRSLSAHHDELLVLLSGLKFTFDIIGLSETKEQCEKGFLSNVNLAGYTIYSQPTKSSNGGVAMHVKSSLNYKVREDLSVTKAEFEMICIEILNRASNRKNDLILIMTPEKQDKTLKLSKHWSVDSIPARNEVIMKRTYPAKSVKCDKICSSY